MKTLNVLSILLFSLFSLNTVFAQAPASEKKETVKVWGECGSCKKTIEAAAKKGGAYSATWDIEKKILQLTYDPAKTTSNSIQQAVAAAGYDTEAVDASASAYDNLPGCCKYERKPGSTNQFVSQVNTNSNRCAGDVTCCKSGTSCCDSSGNCINPAICKENVCCNQ